MPSMVDNIVSIIGTYDELAPLAEAVQERKLLQTIKPLTDTAAIAAKEQWGTSWDVLDTQPDFHDTDGNAGEGMWFLGLQFESPWAPPIGAYEILHEKDIYVHAFYISTGGLDYGGEFEDGENKCYELNNLPKNIKEAFEVYDYDRLMYPDEWPEQKPAA